MLLHMEASKNLSRTPVRSRRSTTCGKLRAPIIPLWSSAPLMVPVRLCARQYISRQNLEYMPLHLGADTSKLRTIRHHVTNLSGEMPVGLDGRHDRVKPGPLNMPNPT